MSVRQLDLLEVSSTGPDALEFFSESDCERGEVFTKRAVVEFILDLTNWIPSTDLTSARLLEPSCGSGDFLIPALERLLTTADLTPDNLIHSVRAVEVHRPSLECCRDRVDDLLSQHGMKKSQRSKLLNAWLVHGDFLTTEFPHDFTHIVGNPPYVRQEALPDELLKFYRTRFRTMYDRADLYVPFFEKSLTSLSQDGRLGFICADRWMKNKYGGPLRRMIAEDFHLESYIDFTGCPAFQNEVVAYPAVTIIKRGSGTVTGISHRPLVDSESLGKLAAGFRKNKTHPSVLKALNVTSGDDPWLLDNPQRLSLIRQLECKFPVLEEAGCKIGIGVATGADKIFIHQDKDLPVESTRKLPLVMTRDIKQGCIEWGGHMLLNPYEGDTPKLVDLENYPLFSDYVHTHRKAISKRHTAKKNPSNWYKTIDRVYPTLLKTPKLLIPDIKGEPTVAYDSGEYYPHHNFYFITSNDWNLRALQAVLLSPVAQSFVATYSLRMRGDCLRYQAQYLRRIRVPLWRSITAKLQNALEEAGTTQNSEKIRLSVQSLFNLDNEEWDILCSS